MKGNFARRKVEFLSLGACGKPSLSSVRRRVAPNEGELFWRRVASRRRNSPSANASVLQTEPGDTFAALVARITS